MISRAEAQALGLKKFFTGQPCRRGHVAERYTNGGACVECVRLDNALKGRIPAAQARPRGRAPLALGSVRPLRRLRRARPVSVQRQNNGRRTEGSQRQVRLLIDRMTLCVRVRVIQRFRQYRGGRPAPRRPQSICDLAMGIQCCGGPLVLITRRQMMGNWC